MYYDDFFKMFNFTDEEISANRSRIEYMLEKIDAASEKDIDHAYEFSNNMWDLSIPGLKDMLKISLLEFIDGVHAKIDHEFYVAINYPVMPALTLGLNYAAQRTGANVTLRGSSQNAINTLGTIFDKYTRVLEAGELLGQAAGKAHCAQYQAEAGLLKLGILPVPDLAVASGWLCDQGAEGDEMLSHLFGFESINLEGCMDWPWDQNLHERGINYNAASLERAFQRVGEVTGVFANDEDNGKGWAHFGAVGLGMYTLINTIGDSNPQCMSQADASIVYMHSASACSIERKDMQLAAINEMIMEANRRIEEGIYVVPKDAPKVYVGMRVLCDVRPIRMIEDCGLSITNLFIDGRGKYEKMPPVIQNPNHYQRGTEYFFKRPCLSSIQTGWEYQKDMVDEHHCDGVLLSYLFNCRPYAISPMMAKDYLERETGKPTMVLEVDMYDTRLYSAEQQRTRVESFAEMLKLNKEIEAMKAAQ